jgi:hypothetical protein
MHTKESWQAQDLFIFVSLIFVAWRLLKIAAARVSSAA